MNGSDESGGQSPAPSSIESGDGAAVDLGLPALTAAVEIGRGAAGVVYRADQPTINRTVAVKMLPYAAMDEAARTRFERETRAMGALSSHPSIVTVYDAGFAPTGQPYIIMELMEGGSLGDRLLRDGRMSWEEVVDIGIKLAGALDAAHKKGVLHRDIKPDNVLISSYGEPKLADFSIARVHGAQQTQTGLVSATPAHAAPEILRGDPPTEQADVYSLGSTLLTLLYGSAAFVRDTDTSIFPVLARVERDPVPDLRGLGVPDEVCRVLERAMAKDPAYRQQSATELAAELKSARDAVKGLGTARIGPAPPPMPGATAIFSPMSAPTARAATGTQPGAAIARPAPSNRAKLIIGGAAAAVVVAVVAALLLLKGGGGATGNGSSTTSGSPQASATPSTIPATGLAAKILPASALGSGYKDFNRASTIGDLAPCVGAGAQAPQLPAGLSESSKAFQLQNSDGTVTIVDIDLAAFPSGQAAQYISALRTASGACGSWHSTTAGLDSSNTIQAIGTGTPLGTGATLRFEVQSTKASGLVEVTDYIVFQQGDVVAVVSNQTTNTGDPNSANRIAVLEADKVK